jgi:hypothetical protein
VVEHIRRHFNQPDFARSGDPSAGSFNQMLEQSDVLALYRRVLQETRHI